MNRVIKKELPTRVENLVKSSRPLVEAMTDLFQQGQKSHHEAYPQMFGPATDRVAITRYMSGFFKPRNPLRTRRSFAKGWFVAEALSGYLLYHLHETSNVFFGKPRWSCFVEDIVVDESARGLGGASALMESLLAEVELLDNCAISGTVWNGNNSSASLFEKHGFQPLSQAYYRISE